MSICPHPIVFQNFIGTLDSAGNATGILNVPVLPGLTGFEVYFAAVTFDSAWPSQVKGISSGFSLIVQ